MAQIETQATLPRPIGDVYRQYADFTAMPQWHKDVISVELISAQPLRAGSMMSMQRRQFGGIVLVNADFTEVERNKTLEMNGMWGRFPFKRRIEFSPSGRETIIKDTMIIRTFILFFWYTPFLLNGLKRQLKAEWQALRDYQA